VWFAALLGRREPPVERAQDWGEAPDTLGFVGRVEELDLLHRWVLDDRNRVVALLGFGHGGGALSNLLAA
jgi:hypothetical protein